MLLQTIKSDVFKFLETNKNKYDIIFADPPYDFDKETFSKIPKLVFENQLLDEEGVLIIEHSKHTDLSDVKYFSQSKNYGGNAFSFFRYN